MQILENDYVFLRASVPEIEKYLLSDVLYYPITGDGGRQLSGDTTRLTMGNLLLSERRLGAASLPDPMNAEVVALLDRVKQLRNRWFSNWRKKVEVEIPNRLRLWKNYMDDWGENPHSAAGEYRYNVRLRVILELLLEETDQLFVSEKSLLHSLDLRLKGKGIPGPFIWDLQIVRAFPSDRFWYLYLKV